MNRLLLVLSADHTVEMVRIYRDRGPDDPQTLVFPRTVVWEE